MNAPYPCGLCKKRDPLVAWVGWCSECFAASLNTQHNPKRAFDRDRES